MNNLEGNTQSASTVQSSQKVSVTIIIPVYNEEILIESAIDELHKKLETFQWDYEIIITENGSTDRTRELIKKLQNKYTEVRGIYTDEPNYGLALRRAIKDSCSLYVICDEIDLCDSNFHKNAIAILEADEADMVIGSKRIPGAEDRRPWFRRLASNVFNIILKILLNVKATETHGLKAFKRVKMLPIVDKCIVDKDIFATELVIRSEQENYRLKEIPIEIEEKRETNIPLLKRVPKALKQVFQLVQVIRFNRKV